MFISGDRQFTKSDLELSQEQLKSQQGSPANNFTIRFKNTKFRFWNEKSDDKIII